MRASVANITSSPIDGGSLEVKPFFSFQSGTDATHQRQLTSLEYFPAWKGFLIITATADEDNAFHGNALWFLADDQVKIEGLSTPAHVWDFEVAMKAEGLCVLPGASDKSARLLIAYDNDPHATHIPSRMHVVKLSRP